MNVSFWQLQINSQPCCPCPFFHSRDLCDFEPHPIRSKLLVPLPATASLTFASWSAGSSCETASDTGRNHQAAQTIRSWEDRREPSEPQRSRRSSCLRWRSSLRWMQHPLADASSRTYVLELNSWCWNDVAGQSEGWSQKHLTS